MFTGSIVALITPMDLKGNVCRSSLKKLIDYHVASGTSAIVSVGTGLPDRDPLLQSPDSGRVVPAF